MAALAQPLIDHHDAIVRLCRAYGVERLEVFGSAADGRFDPARSDFDFIVRLAPRPEASLARRFLGFVEGLEALLGRPVDVLSDGPIENPYLRRAVDASRRTLHDEPAAKAPA
ncbi:MAG: nucleotidyltransferase domain-containing protein [Ideonella sp.]|nr:nucleotidyltransferase domain-containing protein [Ideonella sp.]MCC7459622.1 nucleotidyltransferase domain-containing protein [Nitrospira sp.]